MVLMMPFRLDDRLGHRLRITPTSGNPVLCMEIVGPHKPNRSQTLNCESWGGGFRIHAHSQMSIVNPPPPRLTIVNPGQDQ